MAFSPAVQLLRHHRIYTRHIAKRLGVSESYVSQQLSGARRLQAVTKSTLLQMTGDASMVAQVEELAGRDFREKHPELYAGISDHIDGASS